MNMPQARECGFKDAMTYRGTQHETVLMQVSVPFAHMASCAQVAILAALCLPSILAGKPAAVWMVERPN